MRLLTQVFGLKKDGIGVQIGEQTQREKKKKKKSC